MVKLLVFDTETTGLPPKLPGSSWDERQTFDASLLNPDRLESWNTMLQTWPSIIQLSYILYDTDNPNSAKIFNKYIDIPDNVVISEGSMDIHHITREKIASVLPENRATIQDALHEFLDDVKKAEIVVGHNVQFDRKMIVAELIRLSAEDNLPQIHDMMNESNFECTMVKTTPICNLTYKQNYIDKKTGQPKFFYKIKSPKLLESYKHFFGYEPTGEALHDALVDVIVCLRIFCSYKYSIDVCGTNPIITNYIKQISPQGYQCPQELDSIVTVDVDTTKTISGGKKRRNRNKRSKSSRSSRGYRRSKSSRSSRSSRGSRGSRKSNK
jgi:DNA polymerase III epsilon subunit-like protein